MENKGYIITELKPVIVNKICDKCGVGKMLKDKDAPTSVTHNIPKNIWTYKRQHKCDNCGNTEVYINIEYPYNTKIPVEREATIDEINYLKEVEKEKQNYDG